MRRLGFIGFAVLLPVLSTSAAEGPAGDQLKFQGTWNVLAGNDSGKTLPPNRVKGSNMVVKDNKIAVHANGKQRAMTFTLDVAKDPRAITFTIEDGKRKGETSKGIYEFRGDLLKICFSAPGKARPANFTPAPRSGEMLFVLKRAP